MAQIVVMPQDRQIDWETVRERTEASPFAKAFFMLVEALGIVEV